MPGWIPQTLKHDKLDLKRAGGYSYQPTEALLEQFDRNV